MADVRDLIFQMMANELKGSKKENRIGIISKFAKDTALGYAKDKAKEYALNQFKGVKSPLQKQNIQELSQNAARLALLRRTNQKDLLSRQSTQLIKDAVKDTRVSNRRTLLNGDKARTPSNIQMGNLYFFGYLPESRDKYDFFDEFPLVLMLKREKNGFIGLNFHYLRNKLRADFFDALLDYSDVTNYDVIPGSAMKISYEMLLSPKFKNYYKPCIRSYRFKNFITGLYEIDPRDWKTMMFLPLEKFSKMSREDVWKWSDTEVKK
jgi:hypothetical protein